MADMNELIGEDLESSTRPAGHPQDTYSKNEEGAEAAEAMQMDKLAMHISAQWTENKNDRVRIEQEMMRLQEAVNQEYDPNTIRSIRAQGGSEIFIPLTSMQCNAGSSWLLSVLNPPGDKAFSFKPTPVPELPESIKQKIESDVKQTLATNAPKVQGAPPPAPGAPPPAPGTPPPPPVQGEGMPAGPDGAPLQPSDVKKIAGQEAEEQYKNYKKESIKRAERMEGLVYDQLVESGWYETLEDFILDLTVFPSAFIKTTYEYKTTMAVTTVDGQFTMQAEEKLVGKDERVSAFDMYPSPDQQTVHDGSMIERLRLSRTEVYNCLDKPGYSNENILKVLEETDGAGFASWQSNVDSTRRYSENHSTDFSGQDGSMYGLRFLGPVSIDDMLDWGFPVEDLVLQGLVKEELDENGRVSQRDRLREIDIDAILIGNHVIKAVPNGDPEGKRPYYMASYRKVPGSFWGKSVAMLAQPHQRMANATARALSNNMGIASGPQIVVYTDRLPNGETLQDIRPLKIWQMVSDPAGSNAKPIDFFQPNSNANELMAVYQYFMDSVGDVTGIPKQSYSSDPTRAQQGAQTSSGLAMLLETASKQIKKAVMNIDTGVIEPRLRYQYRTNMMNPEVANRFKGDMSIRATGAKSIVAKAVENQRAMELLQATSNPMDMEVLGQEGRASLLRGIMRNYDMADVAPSAEDMEKRAQEAAQQEKPPSPEETKLEIEKLRSQTRIEDQKLEGELAREQMAMDMQIAQMELERKQIDSQIAVTNAEADRQAKSQQIALKESNNNARFQTEVALKQAGGTGV